MQGAFVHKLLLSSARAVLLYAKCKVARRVGVSEGLAHIIHLVELQHVRMCVHKRRLVLALSFELSGVDMRYLIDTFGSDVGAVEA